MILSSALKNIFPYLFECDNAIYEKKIKDSSENETSLFKWYHVQRHNVGIGVDHVYYHEFEHKS